jgi:RNA polymerase sigma factor (sigma-70 family)
MPETSAAVVVRYLRRLADDPGSGVVSDAELLQRFVAQRDEAAFELLLWRHAAMVLNVCRGVLRDEHAAEDAFQATFLALARKASAIGRREALGGWLYQVAYRAALKARARTARTAASNPPCLELDSLPAPPAPPDEWGDLLPLLHEELNRLPGKYRTPLVLCYLEGQTHADAARQIGWPKGTVSGRLARGREMLRKRLLRRGIAPSAALVAAALTGATASAVPPTLFTATVHGALAFAAGSAAGVSPSVVHLTEGVLHAMFVSKIRSVGVSLLVACTVLGTGLLSGWAVAQKTGGGPSTTPAAEAKRGRGSEAGAPSPERSINNLKHIALAAHGYLDVHGHFPGDLVGSDRKPLLSWRVLILPYLEENTLYKQFKLDEPWDSEHNLKLLSKMPAIFQTGIEGKGATNTYYQGFADERGMFPPGGRVRVADVPDGLSNTLMVIEAGTPVPWTKPADLPYTSNRPLPKLGGPFHHLIHAAFADGAVAALKREFDEKAMRLAITRDDGEVQDIQNLKAESPKARAKAPRKEPAQEEVQRAMEEAAAARDLANREAQRAEELAVMLKREVEATRARAKQSEAMLRKALETAEITVAQLKSDNATLRATLRQMEEQLSKAGVPSRTEKAPAGDDIKKLGVMTEKLQDELNRLRAELEQLKKAAGK